MNRNILIIQVVAFLDLLAVHMIVPSLPLRARNCGASHIQVGLLASLYAGFQLISGPCVVSFAMGVVSQNGSFSDNVGRKYVLLLTILSCSFAYMYFGKTESVYVMLLLRSYLGIFKHMQLLTRAMVPDYEPDPRKQSDIVGKMAAASATGVALGPVIGGQMMEMHQFETIAFISGSIFIVNAILVSQLSCPTDQRSSISRKGGICGALKKTFIDLYNVKWSLYGDIFMCKALVGFALSSYYSNYAFYLNTVFELTPKYIGYTISLNAVIATIVSYFISYIDRLYYWDHDYSHRNFHVFSIMTMAIFGLAMSPNIYCYVLCLVPLSIGNAVGRIALLEMMLKRSHGRNRGTLIGAANSVRAFSGVIAPLSAGYVSQYIGTTYVIFTSCMSTFLGVLLSYHMRCNPLHSRRKRD